MSQLAKLRAGLDEDAFQRLEREHPAIASALRHDVMEGASASQVRMLIENEYGSTELAHKCQQAARFIERVRDGQAKSADLVAKMQNQE